MENNSQIYAVAQIESIRNNIAQNIARHIEFTEEASKCGANIIIFPEMSLTGYERECAKRQHFTVDDSRFEALQHTAVTNNIIVAVGAPLLLQNKLYISSILFFPDKPKEI